MKNWTSGLAPVFQAVARTLEAQQAELNQADPINANHGDHMTAVFQAASQAAQANPGASLAEAMDAASRRLFELPDNATAQIYARGLDQFARQFRERNIEMDDLAPYVQGLLEEKEDQPVNSTVERPSVVRGAEVLKALVAGLSGWQQVEADPAKAGQDPGKPGLDYLFDLGVAYMQAKSRGGSRLEVLADAAASASPLSQTPYRYQSGRLALQALLQALANGGVRPQDPGQPT
jgi:hypothetical protein